MGALKICWDGAQLLNTSFFCAYGRCNAFRCDCVGGCRFNWKITDAQGIRLHKAFEISQKGLDKALNGTDIIRMFLFFRFNPQFKIHFHIKIINTSTFPGETGLLTPQRRNHIAKSMTEIARLVENWSLGNVLESSKIYRREIANLEDEVSYSSFTKEALRYICMASNEYDENPANRYAKEITLRKLLNVYRVGEGGQAICKYLKYDLQ